MVPRNFIVGSEWLYYKIYTGPKTADIILNEVVLPLVQDFESNKWIKKWFFIRYADPKSHLRIRFLVSEFNSIANIIEDMHVALQPFVQQDLVWKVQLDTYNRELERYGKNNIQLSESLFCIDSKATIQFLDLIEGEEGERLRWLFGLRAINGLIASFDYSLEEKLQLMEGLKISFGKEFNMSRPLKKQLDERYRKERNVIEHFMTITSDEENEYQPIFIILQDSYKKNLPIARKIIEAYHLGKLEVPKNNLMSSYIHMLMNRLFKSKNRLNEMVCYDFLYRYYKTLRAKEKIQY